MVDLLADSPLLLLFLVVAIGYPLGRLRVAGFSLGVAAVLFTGIAIGAIDPRLRLPELVYQLGLVIFVYTIGLTSGPGFFASFRRRGLRDNLFALCLLLFAVGLLAATATFLGLQPAAAAGVFAGSLTNTPALAGLLETIQRTFPAELAERIAAEPAVGYSLAYPIGVIAPIVAIAAFSRIARIDYAAEARQLKALVSGGEELGVRTVLVTRQLDEPVHAFVHRQGLHAIIGRVKRGDELFLATPETRLQPGDLVNVIADAETIDRLVPLLGERSPERLELDRRVLDMRRIFVSRPDVVGKRLRDLALQKRFGAVVTRVRRGDVDLLVDDDTTLELGDRVRVVAPRARMNEVTLFFGDSLKALSEIDMMTFGVGIAIGLAVGAIPIPLPGEGVFRLGLAGGPLLVGLVLGTFARTGPIVWTLPFSANLTLRQLGLILFLAAVGTRSGYAFVNELVRGDGLVLLLVGALVSTVNAFLALWIGYRLLRIPAGMLGGILAGITTQPAVLAFAQEQARNELPSLGYAEVFPLATITKIVAAQLLLTLLG